MNTYRIPIALQQAVMRCLREKLAQANARLNQSFPEPAISWHQRGTVAVTAWLEHYEIRLNPVLLLANQQTFIDSVVPHELAHLLVWKRFGKTAPHGKEWRWMMETILDVPAQRTHCFDISALPRKTFLYRCACRQHHLTIRRHNKTQRGETEYRCTQCGQPLRLASEKSV